MNEYVEIPGLNVRHPWAIPLVRGIKRIETRNYPLPTKYLSTPIAIIETPGTQNFKARIVGLVQFEKCFEYLNHRQWCNDYERHLIKLDDVTYAYSAKHPKWGWEINSAIEFATPLAPPVNHGIKFVQKCPILKNVLDESKWLGSLLQRQK